MKCPKCKKEMEKVKWNIGFGILVDSLHCPKCKFNITDEKKLDYAMGQLRKKMSFERKVVRIGTGIGIRFPNEVVEKYRLGYGKAVKIVPERHRIIVEPKD
jgi:phage FluMu protein Com